MEPGEWINIEDFILIDEEGSIFPETTAEEYESLFYGYSRCPVDNAPNSICTPDNIQ